jgi:CBS domain containing-hemolysin-like protein
MDINLGYRFLLVFLIIALNAFFSGAEVSLLSVRQSRLRQMAEDGVVGAQAALSLLANPERLLSVVQVGVTIASLGLGWAGEDTVYAALSGWLEPWMTPTSERWLRGAGFAASFLLITYAHVVLGEVVPKNLSIEHADRLAVMVSPALLVFYRVSGPFVTVIERSATWVSRLIGLRGGSAGSSHSAEELKYIVGASQRHGHIDEFEERAITRLLEIREYSAREIMVPRHSFVSAPVEADLDALLASFNEHKHSRMLIYERDPEQVLGILYAKDLLQVWHQRRLASQKRRTAQPFHLRRLLKTPAVVPETKPLVQLVDEFRLSHVHLALVVDEFGSVTGLVTLEDVLEQIFGEIEDEHDVRTPPSPVVWDALELDGSINIRDLERQHGIELPANSGFETLAGFLLFRLGAIPTPGQEVTQDELKFTVLEMERNRIAKVLVEKAPSNGDGADQSENGQA